MLHCQINIYFSVLIYKKQWKISISEQEYLNGFIKKKFKEQLWKNDVK